MDYKNYRHSPKSLFLVSSQWQSKFYWRKTSFTWHESLNEYLGLSKHCGNCLFQKPILRMSCSVIIREWNAPSFTFQCSFPIRMALEWKCSHIIVKNRSNFLNVTEISPLGTNSTEWLHISFGNCIFIRSRLGADFFKVDMQLDYKWTHNNWPSKDSNMSALTQLHF